MFRTSLVSLSLTAAALLSTTGASADTPSAARAEYDAPAAGDGKSDAPKKGAILLGAKVGGLVAFSGLNPNARAGIEAGYVFPWANRSFAAVLDVAYAAPQTDGSQAGDPRVASSKYNWHLTEQQLTVMPTFVYRLTSLGKLVPYAGIGPRVYLLESTVRGDVGGVKIADTTEKSTKIGAGIPIGAQLELGPGSALAELLLEYGPLDHTATGSSNTGAASLFLGYRFLL